jgi:hypothetical protein
MGASMNYLRMTILTLVLALAIPSVLNRPMLAGSREEASHVSLATAASMPPGLDSAVSPLLTKADRASRRGNRHRDDGKGHRERASRDDVEPATTICEGAGLQLLPQSGLCTHGPDPAPPGFRIKRAVPPVARAEARSAMTAEACDGDGTSGKRVQVLYLHAEGVASRFNQFLPSFRTWVNGADEMMQGSAAETGGSRRFRFVTNPSCQLAVQAVALPPGAIASFDATVTALRSRGFKRSDRFYLSFVDANVVCGVGTLWFDERSGGANRNNTGPAYSRVDAGCWDAFTVAHELMHNLGAVQQSAPNDNGGAHCIDDYDVMCYQDGPNAPVPAIVCPDEAHEDRYDCGHNDYFHTDPPSGNYLATHWNTANNLFLIGSPNAAPDVSISITSPLSGATFTVGQSVTIEVAVSGLTEATVQVRRCGGTRCAWAKAKRVGSDASAPYQVSWTFPKKGSFTLLAKATGSKNVSQPVTVSVE